MAGHGNYAVIFRRKAALPLRTFPDKNLKIMLFFRNENLQVGSIAIQPMDPLRKLRSARRKPKVAGVSLGKTPFQGEPGLTFSPIGH